MTSEVCVMNRLAVVLAADSATTVTRFDAQGKKEERYFKGANKIFQISDRHPVGMMIFDSADLLRVPWEVIVKEFRKHLGPRPFHHVREYADEFFTFLNETSWLLPMSVQKEKFLDAARIAAIQTCIECGAPLKDEESPDTGAYQAKVIEIKDQLTALPLLPCLAEDDGFVEAILGGWSHELKLLLEQWREGLENIFLADLNDMVQIGLLSVLKNPGPYLGTTGLVFAGFGDRDVFPAMVEYTSCGMVAGRHASYLKNEAAIDFEMPAWLSAFAQTAMSDTFSVGISEDAYGLLMQSLTAGLSAFAEKVVQESGGDLSKINDLKGEIGRTTSTISDTLLGRLEQAHALPLRRVLSVLPVDEMAELAETLINLQSLKEKVTMPSETVGGPVDVAVITRGEGLVWIKRKHYFDLKLNSRYLHRQSEAMK